MPRARAVPSSASPSISTPAGRAWWRSTSRQTANGPSGSSSAISGHLPAAGEMVLFDRSWYNRAGVERVMGFCERRTSIWNSCARLPEIERMIVRSGALSLQILVLGHARGTELRRFQIPRGRTPEEVETLAHRPAVPGQVGRLHRGEGGDVLLHRYRRRTAGVIVKSNDKKRARLELYAAFPVERCPMTKKDEQRGRDGPIRC